MEKNIWKIFNNIVVFMHLGVAWDYYDGNQDQVL